MYLRSLSFKKQIEGFEVYERFYEIGSINGIKETEKYFLKNNLIISSCIN